MIKRFIYFSLLLILTCAKEDSQAPNTPPTQIVKQYALTANAGEGGSVTGGGTYTSGTQVSITATPSSGYSFSGWSNGSSTNPLTVTLNSNTTITANFQVIVNSYTLSVTPGEGGSVSSEGGEYEEGTEVTISATPYGCYSFNSWSDGNTNSQRTVSINGDQNITANFESLANNIEYSLVNLTFPCAATISTERSYNETNSYEVGPFGWFSVKMQETHPEWYYPSNTDYHPPGAFSMDPHNFAHGDFNNDGLQDLVITWATFPHTLERASRYNYSIFLNNGDGSMTYDHEAVASSTAHNNHMAYRTLTADFNGDGLDDIVSASMGVIQRLPGQDPYTRWERIPLLLSLGDGRFYDASTNIEGQEDNISPPEGHSFGHELSIGDVDGDGDVDIYTGKILLLNNGSGSFTNNTDLLPEEIKPSGRNLWSSVIADFNNDGIDDFFVPYAETTGASWEQYTDFSGAYSLSKDGKPSYENSNIGFVTKAKYGIGNTKFNYAIDYDINLDGYKDIVIAVTRVDPYYVGKGLQVFLNTYDSETGNRKFIPGDNLLPNEGSLDSFHGEGQLSVIDVNNDGILDIAHTSGAYGNEKGLSFYINNGGNLELFDMNQFAYATENQLIGKESWANNNTLRRAIPINLDNSGWIDYISIIGFGNGDGSNEILLYSVLSKN